MLLQYGSPANVRELSDQGTGLMPLHYACKNGHADAASALLQAGVEINAVAGDVRTPAGSTPLHLACANGAYKLVKVLLGKQPSGSCDLSMLDSDGRTVLAVAIENNHGHIQQALEKEGAC